jgi:hypothetical protein
MIKKAKQRPPSLAGTTKAFSSNFKYKAQCGECRPQVGKLFFKKIKVRKMGYRLQLPTYGYSSPLTGYSSPLNGYSSPLNGYSSLYKKAELLRDSQGRVIST